MLKSMHIRNTSETGNVKHAFTFVQCKFRVCKLRHWKFSKMIRLSFNAFNLCQFIGRKLLGFIKSQNLLGTKNEICLKLLQCFTEIFFLPNRKHFTFLKLNSIKKEKHFVKYDSVQYSVELR